MSSEHLASAQNELKGNLGGAWNILDGAQGQYQDLGIARRFGGSSAAYSLRDIGAMNGRVVKARRDVGETSDPEEDFSANQVQSGALEDWVNGKLETTLPADSSQGLTVVVQHSLINSGTETTIKFYADGLTSGSPKFFSNDKTYKFYKGLSDNRYILQLTDSTNLIKASASDADKLPQDVTTYESLTGTLTSITVISSSPAEASYSLRKANNDYTGDAVRIRRSSDDVEVDVALDSDDKVSASSAITNVAEQGGEIGSTTATDLNGFLTEQSFFYKQEDNTSSSSYSLSRNSSRWDFSKVSSVSDGTTTKTGEILKLEATGTDGTFLLFTNPEVGCTNHETTITFDYLFPSSNSDTDIYVNVNDSASTSAGSPTVTPNDINGAVSGTWTTASHTFSSASSGQIAIRLTNSPTSTIGASVTPDAGDEFYITNLKVSTVKAEAFVHTWYDQAGSNNAVQETDSKQPKIAENGALLADGIDFDGVNDELRTSTNIASSQPVTVMSVTKPDAVNKRIFESITNSVRAFYGGSSQTGMNAGNTLLGSTNEVSTNTEYLQTHLFNTTNSKVFLNNVETISGDAGSNAFAGNFSLGGSSAVFDGTMKEVIVYLSDQSANRFKIESNINNYYGLYNDANEFASDETAFRFLNERSGGTSASSDLSQYTLDVQTASAYAGAKFSSNVLSGDSIYVSFNASLDEGSFTASPKVGLRNIDSFLNGTLYSNEGAVTEGFNSFQLTSTNSAASGIVWSEGDDNVIFTISDFKVSRIARNGFVETWYDQSGNSNDAVQASAGNQPAIVQNGGLVTDGIRFETDNELETGGNITASTITGFVVANLKGTDANSLYSLGSDSSAAPSVLFGNPSLSYAINGGTPLAGGTAPTFANSLFTQLFISGGTSKSFIDGSQIASGDAGSNTASSGKITIGNLASSTRYANIAMNELIVFTSDKSTDQDEIEEDISRNYNITLS